MCHGKTAGRDHEVNLGCSGQHDTGFTHGLPLRQVLGRQVIASDGHHAASMSQQHVIGGVSAVRAPGLFLPPAPRGDWFCSMCALSGRVPGGVMDHTGFEPVAFRLGIGRSILLS